MPFALPHFCLSVYNNILVWPSRIECCLFLLRLGRQGALWETTRDQIDYAASLLSRPIKVIVSSLHCCVFLQKICPWPYVVRYVLHYAERPV